ncbi:hypothetical protein Naga_100178g1, partial [Nannochloropsis gaditana]
MATLSREEDGTQPELSREWSKEEMREEDLNDSSYMGVMSFHSQGGPMDEERVAGDAGGRLKRTKASTSRPFPPSHTVLYHNQGHGFEDESNLSASSLTSLSLPSPSSSALAPFQGRDSSLQGESGPGRAPHEHLSSNDVSATAMESMQTEAVGTVPPAESMGDEYKRMAAQKAQRERRYQALVTSKEHARRNFPRMRRIYTDYHLKVMVAGEAGHGKTTCVREEG